MKQIEHNHTKGGILISNSISKTVDKTAVTGSETFVYTVKLAFSGLAGEYKDGTAEDFIPDIISYTLPPLSGQLTSIDEIPEEGGTRLVFHYTQVPVGLTVEFSMSAYFSDGRRDGDSFTNEMTLYQEGADPVSATAETVTLTLDSNFYLVKYFSGVSNPKVGESFYCTISLRNTGDGGASLNDVLISDVLPSELVADTTFTPIGEDNSSTFPDVSMDGKTGTWVNSALYFPLESYSGKAYNILFKVQVDERVSAGTSIENTATWTVEGVEQKSAVAYITTYEDKAQATMVIQGPSHAQIGGDIQYVLLHQNTGTVDLTDYVVETVLPTELVIEEVNYFATADRVYSLYFTTIENPDTEIVLGENLSGNSGVLDLTLLTEEQVEKLIYKASTMDNSGSMDRMLFSGNVKEDAVVDSTMVVSATLTGDSSIEAVENTATASTILDNVSYLQVSKSLVDGKNSYYPLEELFLELKANNYHGQTATPIFADLLPKELVYLADRAYYIYYDSFLQKTYDSREEGFPVPLPTIEVLEDYEETESTLVRFIFQDFTLLYQNYLSVYFPVMVKIGATSFSNYGYLGNPSNNAITYGGSSVDVLDLDGDGSVDETIAMSEEVSATVLYNSAFTIEKWVKGNLDSEYTTMGTATPGGEVSYRLCLTNNQEAVLSQVDMVEILPYVGDTGVILVGTERDSAFSVTLSAVPTAEIAHIITGEVKEAEITVSYSTSTDPERFGSDGSTIGTGTWTEEVPEDLSSVAAIRIQTAEEINSYELLVVTLQCQTPVAVPSGEIAYNSFAVAGDVVMDEETSSLLPTEPTKVSVTIEPSDLGSVGGFVWYDTNEDGLYDDGEEGVNGVIMELYDFDRILLATTVTADDYEGNAGYYRFADLEAGIYRVKFIPTGFDTLTVQNLEAENGSKAAPTGFGPLFSLETGESVTNMNAGVYHDWLAALQQAKNDVITSIALEEAGIKGILDAEGAKIQQAVALDLTTEELLAVNDSVNAMVTEITALEEVLLQKLTLVSVDSEEGDITGG